MIQLLNATYESKTETDLKKKKKKFTETPPLLSQRQFDKWGSHTVCISLGVQQMAA